VTIYPVELNASPAIIFPVLLKYSPVANISPFVKIMRPNEYKSTYANLCFDYHIEKL
jgi:hypothetical protein